MVNLVNMALLELKQLFVSHMCRNWSLTHTNTHTHTHTHTQKNIEINFILRYLLLHWLLKLLSILSDTKLFINSMSSNR
jgi:hypothetical protein